MHPSSPLLYNDVWRPYPPGRPGVLLQKDIGYCETPLAIGAAKVCASVLEYCAIPPHPWQVRLARLGKGIEGL